MGKGKYSESTENLQSKSVNNISQDEQQSGNSSSNFVDNSPEAVEARRLQELADSSQETEELQQLQENATGHDNSLISQQIPQKKKKKQAPKKTSLKDYIDKKPEHDPGKLSDAKLQATVEYAKWKKKFVSKKESSYSEAELLLACRLTIREFREKGTAPKSIVKLGEQYLKQAKTQGTVADKAIGFDGELKWNKQAGKLTNTDFGKWILEKGPEPNAATSILNCWELVLYSAFKAGVLQKSRIVTLYKKFGTDLSKGVTAAFNNFDILKKGKEYTYDKDNPDSPKPIKGDMVIFKDFKNHVTIATGNTTSDGEIEIMSLWTQNNKKTYKTTVEELLKKGGKGPVKFFTPNW